MHALWVVLRSLSGLRTANALSTLIPAMDEGICVTMKTLYGAQHVVRVPADALVEQLAVETVCAMNSPLPPDRLEFPQSVELDGRHADFISSSTSTAMIAELLDTSSQFLQAWSENAWSAWSWLAFPICATVSLALVRDVCLGPFHSVRENAHDGRRLLLRSMELGPPDSYYRKAAGDSAFPVCVEVDWNSRRAAPFRRHAPHVVDGPARVVSAVRAAQDQLRLIHGGKELAHDRPMADYNIADGDVVKVIIRLRGS